jgi:hypothetical protein
MATCSRCGEKTPVNQAESLRVLGWRAVGDPETGTTWRCGKCWSAFKSKTGMPSLPPPSSRPGTGAAAKPKVIVVSKAAKPAPQVVPARGAPRAR